MLKQQLRVYADDFATEREDRERNQSEKEKLKEELDAVKQQLQACEQQVQLLVYMLIRWVIKNVQSYFKVYTCSLTFHGCPNLFLHVVCRLT